MDLARRGFEGSEVWRSEVGGQMSEVGGQVFRGELRESCFFTLSLLYSFTSLRRQRSGGTGSWYLVHGFWFEAKIPFRQVRNPKSSFRPFFTFVLFPLSLLPSVKCQTVQSSGIQTLNVPATRDQMSLKE